MGVMLPAYSDSTKARCEIYRNGQKKPTKTVDCTFSQYQGHIYIDRQDGVSYALTPSDNKPGTYTDQEGKPAYRQAGLGQKGQIFRFTNGSVYVYWKP